MKQILQAAAAVAAVGVLLSACGKTLPDDGPKPWAAGSTVTQTETETETTRQEELSTLSVLSDDTNEASIHLPDGVTGADITMLETMFWSAFFMRDQDFAEAQTADVLPYLTDSASPWGLFRIYDTLDSEHTHGEYEQMSVDVEPDPRGLFPDTYYRVPDSVMTFLLRDVFGVDPDDTAETDGVYCEEGVWYFNALPTGLQATEVHARACQTFGGNHYRITAEMLSQKGESGEMAHKASTFVDVLLKESDGLRVWQVLRIETFE